MPHMPIRSIQDVPNPAVGSTPCGPIRPAARCAVFAATLVLTFAPVPRRLAARTSRCQPAWVHTRSVSSPVAGLKRPHKPGRADAGRVAYGARSIAAVVVLIDRSRRINLSRLGGLQGP